MTCLAAIEEIAAKETLCVLGGFVEDGDTTILLGPDEPNGFWDHFQSSAEATDAQADELDRWSRRVIDGLAEVLGARAFYPFGGAPYHPFFTWALKTGRVHESPVKLLVHDVAGLWVSFRGALRFKGEIDLPPPPPSPCLTCQTKPCVAACPVDALNTTGYDVPACKAFLSTNDGATCMTQGCRVRAVCPVSAQWGRVDAQSAFHMRAFSPAAVRP